MRTAIRMAVVLALVMTACRAEINFVFDIAEDGGGEFALEVGFDEEMLNLMSLGGDGADPFEEMLSEIGTGDLEGATVTRYTEGDMEYARYAITFPDTAGLPDEFFDQTDPDNPFERLKIETTDDGVRFEMVMTMPDATADAGDAFDPSLLTEDVFAFNVRAKLPGSVTDHNATSVLSDGTLQWAIPITGGTVDAFAQSSLSGGGIPTWVIVLIIVGVLAVAAVVLLALRRGKEEPAFQTAEPAQGWNAPAPSTDPFAAPPAPPAEPPAESFKPPAEPMPEPPFESPAEPAPEPPTEPPPPPPAP